MFEMALLARIAAFLALRASSQVLLLIVSLRHDIYINAKSNIRPGHVETRYIGQRLGFSLCQRSNATQLQVKLMIKTPRYKVDLGSGKLVGSGMREALARRELICRRES